MTSIDKNKFCSIVQSEPRELIHMLPDASKKSYGVYNWILIIDKHSVDVLKPDADYPGGKLELSITSAKRFYKEGESYFIDSLDKMADGEIRAHTFAFMKFD